MIMCDIMVSRILALLVWAFVAASVAYWGLRWFAKPTAVPPGTGSVSMTSAPRGDITKLWTGPAVVATDEPDPNAQSALAARIQLLGVVAPRYEGGTSGVALLVVDGKPSQAFKPGQAIDADHIVQSIGPQGVLIGPRGGEALLTLSMPLLPPASTGTLPPPATVGTGFAPPAMVAQAQPDAGVGMAAQPVEGMNPLDPAANPVPSARERRLPPRMRRQSPGADPSSAESTAQE